MSTDLFSLAGRRAVVTGAGHGLGRTIALALADAGADVALLARTADDLERVRAEIIGRGRRALAIPVDVSEPDAVAAAFAAIDAGLGGLEILVNNAGTNVRKPTLEATDVDWHTVLATNLDSAFYCCREAARRMIATDSGREGRRILNIGSVAGLVGIPTGAAYAASKAALAQLTRTLAQEWGPHGINVNCIAPWYFETPLTAALLADEAYRERILKATPLARIGGDRDIAGVALFLASDASAYVTGQTIAVDGGMSTSAFHPE